MSSRWREGAAVVSMLALLGSAPGCGPTSQRTLPPVGDEDDVSLGAGDTFDVRVYGEEDLSASYTVDREGTIDFPYIGRVEVIRLEPPRVADLLEERLREADVLVNPQISVVVTERPSRRISVIGAVRNPGNFSMTPGLTALQAVGLAGGTTDLANRDGAIVTRRVDGDMHRYAIPLDQITVGSYENFPIQSGDIIFVPERPF